MLIPRKLRERFDAGKIGVPNRCLVPALLGRIIAAMEPLTELDFAVGNNGERMIVADHFVYYAHLSIYRFALPFCTGRRVLDAGSGVGYGAAYLARHGASVLALDAGADAVTHARRRYAGDAVTFEVANLNQPLPCGDRVFDTVFSSNVFEHVANVEGLAAECARVVKADGTVIVAVPPIASASALESDMRNVFHVHHLPPSAWHAKLSRFFADIQCHGHSGIGRWADAKVQNDEIYAERPTTVRETDFEFPKISLADMAAQQITAVFVCRGPRSVAQPETVDERMPLAWHEAAVAAKMIGEERAALEQAKAEASRHDAAIRQAAEQESNRLQAERDKMTAAYTAVSKAASEAAATAADLASQLQHLMDENRELRSDRAQDRCAAELADTRLRATLHSTCWRMTGPLRRMVTALRRR